MKPVAVTWNAAPGGLKPADGNVEAYLKAIGSGLVDRLDQIEVSLAPGAAAELLGALKDSRSWRRHSLNPAAEFVGALVVQPEDS